MRWNILNQTNNGKVKLKTDKIIKILLKNRGVTSKEEVDQFLNPSLSILEKDFFDKKQLANAIKRIKIAIASKEQIVVYSDYDVDGITAGAILWETLYALGAKAMPFVPDRFKHGYGLSQKGIHDLLVEFPDTKLIVTVDNGISANNAVNYLNKKGIDTIISDHHTVPENTPKAYAIVHTTKLSGSGVAYVFSREIMKRHPELASAPVLNKSGMTNSEHLALSAMGTIADLVPLIGANRAIVTHGLKALNKTKRIGLKALLELCGLSDQEIESYHIGFVIGPRINASGRLSHGLSALQLLCTNSKKRAHKLALHLNNLNTSRQKEMKKAYEHALALVNDTSKLIFVSDSSYHEGVIGLVAGNLVDKHYRPAIVLSIGETVSKASARSIKGVNIYTLLNSASDIFDNFGGHPMAAGFSVKTNQIDVLKKRLQTTFDHEISDDLLERELRIDIQLSFSKITQHLFSAIQKMKPFGSHNYEPVFYSEHVELLNAQTVGKEKNHLKLTVRQDSKTFDAIGFRLGALYPTLTKKKVSIAYSIMENTWNGKTSIQLKVKDIISSLPI